MAKTKFSKKMKCLAVNQTIGRSTVSFASEIQKAEPGGPDNRQGSTAKNVVSFNFLNAADAAGYTPDKEYTITITE